MTQTSHLKRSQLIPVTTMPQSFKSTPINFICTYSTLMISDSQDTPQLVIVHKLHTRYLYQDDDGTNHTVITRMSKYLSNYWSDFKNCDKVLYRVVDQLCKTQRNKTNETDWVHCTPVHNCRTTTESCATHKLSSIFCICRVLNQQWSHHFCLLFHATICMFIIVVTEEWLLNKE